MKVGKNFSANNLGQRKENDFYETPFSMVKQLLCRVRLEEPILEPACGKELAIVRMLKQEQYQRVDRYDLNFDGKKDFLTERKRYATIITNPPFSLASEFIEHALNISTDSFFLLPLAYLHGKKRFDLFYNNNTLREVFIFTRYPLLGDPLRADGKYRTGMMAYAWYHFRVNNKRHPMIHWIDNNDYVCTAKEAKDEDHGINRATGKKADNKSHHVGSLL